jgi:FkbM family methyltransferase
MGGKIRRVSDRDLGELCFPAGDQIMAPFIDEHHTYIPSEIEWLKQQVFPGSNCLNVGANVGYFTLWMSRLCQDEGRVWALEPNPTLLPLLAQNIDSRNLTNVTVLPVAAGDANGEAELFQNEWNFGDSRVFDPRKTDGGGDHRHFGFDESPGSISVPIVRVDTVLDGERIDVVLLDTQGWEHFVLRGMSATIKRWKPIILAEFTPSWIHDLGEDPEVVIAEYISYGYSVSILEHATPRTLLAREVLPAIAETDLWFVNLVLTPKHVPWRVRRTRTRSKVVTKNKTN